MFQVKPEFRGNITPEPTQERMELIKEISLELFNEFFQEV
jgi:hypothetical protein